MEDIPEEELASEASIFRSYSGYLQNPSNPKTLEQWTSMPRPDLPSAVMIIASGIQTTPDGGLTIIGVNPDVNTWLFPQPLPPLILVALVSGGQPGKVYSTKLIAYDHSGKRVAERVGPDIPFTTQIKRANINYGLQQISAEPIVTDAGMYRFELVIGNDVVGSANLEILRAAQPTMPN